jgi:pimeloyl-ACP methyl ester carboxylesterase
MQQQTAIIRLAEKQNYLVVLPEMGNSLYVDTFFQETIPALKSQRGVAFINQRLIPLMDSLLDAHHLPVLVYGLSTGCRGALQYAAKQKQTLALALLSGDYCFSLDINDRLARRFLGDYQQHRLRWQETGNLIGLATELLCKVFLACGELDQVARPSQSKALKNNLLPQKSELLIKPGAGHEAGFWKDIDDKVIDFFEKALK